MLKLDRLYAWLTTPVGVTPGEHRGEGSPWGYPYSYSTTPRGHSGATPGWWRGLMVTGSVLVFIFLTPLELAWRLLALLASGAWRVLTADPYGYPEPRGGSGWWGGGSGGGYRPVVVPEVTAWSAVVTPPGLPTAEDAITTRLPLPLHPLPRSSAMTHTATATATATPALSVAVPPVKLGVSLTLVVPTGVAGEFGEYLESIRLRQATTGGPPLVWRPQGAGSAWYRGTSYPCGYVIRGVSAVVSELCAALVSRWGVAVDGYTPAGAPVATAATTKGVPV